MEAVAGSTPADVLVFLSSRIPMYTTDLLCDAYCTGSGNGLAGGRGDGGCFSSWERPLSHTPPRLATPPCVGPATHGRFGGHLEKWKMTHSSIARHLQKDNSCLYEASGPILAVRHVADGQNPKYEES